MAFVATALLGWLAVASMPASLFPLVDFPRIVVSVEAGDQPADRMAVEVTRRLEAAVRAVPEAVAVRSTSSRGSCEISLSLSWGADMVAGLMQVDSAVQRTMSSLPPGTTAVVRRMDPTVFPVLGFSLSSERRSLAELKDLADLEFAPALGALEGVAEIEVLGGQTSEVQVLLDPLKLRAYGLSILDVARAIDASNVLAGVGRLEDRSRLFLTLADAELKTTEQVGQLAVRSSPAGIVRLSDLGDVQEGVAPQWVAVNAQGRDAVLVNVKQQRSASAVDLADRVVARVAELARLLPSDVSISTYYDQSQLVVESRNSVLHAIAIGVLLCAAVLWLFLRSRRATMIVVIGLPVVLLATCVVLRALGQGFNVMTLGSLAAAVGLIVDDAVVVIEHIARRIAEQAAAETSHGSVVGFALESLQPLASSSAVTIAVFLPLAFLGGIAGGFFKSLALTMAIALVISFVVAITLVPLLGAAMLRGADAGRLQGGVITRRLRIWTAAAARTAMASPRGVIWAAVALGGVGGAAFHQLPTGFMPHMDEGGFIFDYRAAPGTSLAETDRLLRQVESIVQSMPDVQSYSRRTGVQLGGGLTEANEGDMFIRLRPLPRRHIEDVMRELRGRVEAEVPGLEVETAQLMEDLIGDLIANPQPIEIKVIGKDDLVLRTLATEVARTISTLPGIVEVFDGTRVAGDSIEISVDPTLAGREGLDVGSVTAEIRAALDGVVATQLRVDQREPEVRVLLAPTWRTYLEQLGQIVVRAPDGHFVPVNRIARLETREGAAQIVRDNMRQSVVVTARLDGVGLGAAYADVRHALDAMRMPNGYQIEYGGLIQEQSRSFRELGFIFATVLLLVSTLLVFVYKRFDIALAIIFTSLLCLSGVFLGLWVCGMELNLSSLIGTIMVVGISAELAVFFFAEIATNAPVSSGDLVDAAGIRSRPIVMTSVIAVLALAPLAIGFGGGADMQRPLAIAIISGLLTAIPMVLVFLPSAFIRLQGKVNGRTGSVEAASNGSKGN